MSLCARSSVSFLSRGVVVVVVVVVVVAWPFLLFPLGPFLLAVRFAYL